MLRRWLRVAKAVVLAAVVLGGGGGMPLLDVTLYHGLAPSRSPQSHLEPSGAHCHAERCRLDSKAPLTTQAQSLDLRIQLVTTPFRAPALAPLAPRAAQVDLPHSRAPPTLPA
jgi:hypothetical protein